MKYHWTIYGLPACRASNRVLRELRERGYSARTNLPPKDLEQIITCTADSRGEVEARIETLHRYLPEAACEVVEGDCPEQT